MVAENMVHYVYHYHRPKSDCSNNDWYCNSQPLLASILYLRVLMYVLCTYIVLSVFNPQRACTGGLRYLVCVCVCLCVCVSVRHHESCISIGMTAHTVNLFTYFLNSFCKRMRTAVAPTSASNSTTMREEDTWALILLNKDPRRNISRSSQTAGRQNRSRHHTWMS